MPHGGSKRIRFGNFIVFVSVCILEDLVCCHLVVTMQFGYWMSYQASREGRFAIFTLFGIMSDLRGMGSQYCYVLFVHVTIWATRA